MSHRDNRAVRIVRAGPIMIAGPVSIMLPDGQVFTSDRFQVAICTCHRSSCYPLCDTSHRRGGKDAKKGNKR